VISYHVVQPFKISFVKLWRDAAEALLSKNEKRHH
jgi:hypothetical protein